MVLFTAILGSPSVSRTPEAQASAGIVKVDSLGIRDEAGNKLEIVRTHVDSFAITRLINEDGRAQKYLFALEVRDSEGITALTFFEKGELDPRAFADMDASLSSLLPGDYTLRAFAVDYSESPYWISPVSSTEFSVVSIDLPGVYIPLYKSPDLEKEDGVWKRVLEAKKEHSSVPFIVTINPASGPGSKENARIQEAVSELKLAGVEYILGYVPTGYAKEAEGRSMTDLKDMIDKYREWYPDVSGVMLDQISPNKKNFGFYDELAAYARSSGMTFVRGNAGMAADEAYLAIFDNIGIYEGKRPPNASQLERNTYYPKYSPNKFSLTFKDIISLDLEYLDDIRKYIGLVYVTDDVENEQDRNPYNRLPQYFEELIAQLQRR